MKHYYKAAALAVAGILSVSLMGGCSLLKSQLGNIDEMGEFGEVLGEFSDIQDFADNGRSQIERLISAAEGGNLEEIVSGIDNGELEQLLKGLEDTVGASGREKIDTSDSIKAAEGISASCSGMYALVVDGRVNSGNDTTGYSIQLPAADAPLSERLSAANRLNVGDALKYADSAGAELEGIYYLSSDAGDDHPKGTIISEKDDYFSEAKGKAVQLTEETKLSDIYA